jgi:4-amino-4-deoxy-L-arabinose transferase-like glycosyltransferase
MLLSDRLSTVGDRTFVWSLFVIAASLSVLLIVTVAYDRGIGTDGAFYALSGYHLIHGGQFTYSDVPNTFTWPMLSILVGLLSLAIDNLQICMHIVLTTAFAASVFPLVYGLKNFFGRETALVGGALFVLNGFMIRLSARMLPEMVVVCFVITAWYFVSVIHKKILEGEKAPARYFAMTGLMTGLAYLTKPEAGLFILSGIGALILTVKFREKQKILLTVLAFTVTILPQVIYIHETTGKWQLTTYNRFFFRGVIEPLVSLQPGQRATDPHVESNYNAYIIRQPYSDRETQSYLDKLPQHIRRYAVSFFTIIGLLNVLFLIVAIVRQSFTKEMAVLAWYAMPVLAIFFWYAPTDRLFIPFVPFFLGLTTAFLTVGAPWKSSAGERLRRVLLILVLLQSFTPIANHSPTNAVIGNHARLGRWMRENLDVRGKLIADRKPYVTFDVKGRYFRYHAVSDVTSLVAELRRRKVNYLVVDDFYTRTKNPGVVALLDERKHDGLEFVHEENDPQWGRALLYRVTTP